MIFQQRPEDEPEELMELLPEQRGRVRLRPELERKIEQIDEQNHAEDRHRRRGDEAFDPAHLGRATDRDHEGQEARDDQPERPDDRREQANRDQHPQRAAQPVFLDRAGRR